MLMPHTVEQFAKYATSLRWSVYSITKTGRLYQSWHYGQLAEVGKKMNHYLDRRDRIRLAEDFLDENRRKINVEVKRLLTSPDQ